MQSTEELSQQVIDEFVGVSHGFYPRAKELLDQYPQLANVKARWGETPIEAAAQMNQREIAEMLLQHGAPLDICTAAVFGMRDKVEEFLRTNPDVSQATGAHGIPVLYFPVVGNYREIAELLIEHGAAINAGSGINTPLHGAAMFGRTEMAEWLLSLGADTNATDFDGKTPLQVAEANNHAGVAELLRTHAAA